VTLTQLRYFVHVVALKSFTRAADQLHVAQSALSRQVRLLESELGTALLVRESRSVDLTEAGARLLERAQTLLHYAEETAGAVRAGTGEPAGALRVGFNPSLAVMFAARAIRDLAARLPGTVVVAGEGLTEALKADLLEDRLDLAVASAPEPHPQLAVRLLFWEPLWLIAPARARATLRRAEGIGALHGQPLIQSGASNGARRLFDRAAARHKVRPRVVAETDSLPLIRELVAAGVGYNVSPYSAFREDLESGRLAGFPLTDLRIARGLLRHRDRPVSPAMLAFSRHVEDRCRRELSARRLLLGQAGAIEQ
jgi:LysR family nitrogen assimilation transcriptional regulator